jgi:hypothetical protein
MSVSAIVKPPGFLVVISVGYFNFWGILFLKSRGILSIPQQIPQNMLGCKRILLDNKKQKNPGKALFSGVFYIVSAFAGLCVGSPARTRTADTVVNSHLLCRLSYWGIRLIFLISN